MGTTSITVLILTLIGVGFIITSAYALRQRRLITPLLCIAVASFMAHLVLDKLASQAFIDDTRRELATGTKVIPQGITNLPDWVYDAGVNLAGWLVAAACLIWVFQIPGSWPSRQMARIKSHFGFGPSSSTKNDRFVEVNLDELRQNKGTVYDISEPNSRTETPRYFNPPGQYGNTGANSYK